MARKRNQNKRYNVPDRQISLIAFDNLPSAAQEKARGQGQQNYGKSVKDLTKSDLSPSQRVAASDLACIVDGDNYVILSPTGDFIGAVTALARAI